MKLKPILSALIMSSMLSVEAAPINYECEGSPNPEFLDCPNDEFHTESYEMDYMNFGYAWDKTYGTARVAIVDKDVSLDMFRDPEFSGKLRAHDSGAYYQYGKFGNESLECNYNPGTGHNSDGNADYHFENSGRTEGKLDSNIIALSQGTPDAIISEYRLVHLDMENNYIEILLKKGLNPSNYTVSFNIAAANNIETLNLSHSDFILGQEVGNYDLYFRKNFGGNRAYLNGSTIEGTVVVDSDSSPNVAAASNKIVDCKAYKNGKFGNLTSFKEAPHGEFVYSMFAANANNADSFNPPRMTGASICRECSLSFHSTDVFSENAPNSPNDSTEYQEQVSYGNFSAIKNAIFQGNQIISLSMYFFGGDLSDPQWPSCANQTPKSSLCQTLEMANERDVVIVASNGNQGKTQPNQANDVNWPANESDWVIGVGGVDENGYIWDDRNEHGVCRSGRVDECASQFQPGLSKVMAPANDVLIYNTEKEFQYSDGCFDGNFLPVNDGYAKCSGTSFSAPIISGMVAMFRSLDPLLSFDDIKYVLENNRVRTDPYGRGQYSIPNPSSIIKKNILGYSNGRKIANKAKPMFSLKTGSGMTTNYLSTTVPQVAVSAMHGSYLNKINEYTGQIDIDVPSLVFNSDYESPEAIGFRDFKSNLDIIDNNVNRGTARAAYYIFGGHENPFTGEDDMIPLYRYGYRNIVRSNCNDERKSASGYATNKNNYFKNRIVCSSNNSVFVYEGIEGYLLPECPKTKVGCYEDSGDATAPQCLMIRRTSSGHPRFALFMESEKDLPKYADYDQPMTNDNGMSDSECLGYVFPNVDTDEDLLLDGTELILGTDINDKDSDNDGIWDGVEYPMHGLYISDPLVACRTCPGPPQ